MNRGLTSLPHTQQLHLAFTERHLDYHLSLRPLPLFPSPTLNIMLSPLVPYIGPITFSSSAASLYSLMIRWLRCCTYLKLHRFPSCVRLLSIPSALSIYWHPYYSPFSCSSPLSLTPDSSIWSVLPTLNSFPLFF